MAIQVSVIVPTYQRVELLDRCLQALMNQDFNPAAYEVIVVDDGADPRTQRLVERWSRRIAAAAWAAPPPVKIPARSLQPAAAAGVPAEVLPAAAAADRPRLRYIPARETRGPAAARNLGWRAAAGEVIAFTDDDCIPAPDWLKSGVKAFVDGTAGVSGRMVIPLPPRPTDYEMSFDGLARSQFVTANCFYRRSALLKVGGFDERFPLAWREDSDLYFRMLKSGFRLLDAPQAIVVHPVRTAAWGISLRQQRKAMYNALLYKKHPELYRQKLRPAVPWHYYAAVAALAVFLGACLAASFEIAWLAGPGCCLRYPSASSASAALHARQGISRKWPSPPF